MNSVRIEVVLLPRYTLILQGDSIINGAGCAGESNLGTVNGNTLHSESGGPIIVHCSAGNLLFVNIGNFCKVFYSCANLL